MGETGWSGKFREVDVLVVLQAVGRVHPAATAIPQRRFRLALDMVVIRLAAPAKVVVFGLSAFGADPLSGLPFLIFSGSFYPFG